MQFLTIHLKLDGTHIVRLFCGKLHFRHTCCKISERNTFKSFFVLNAYQDMLVICVLAIFAVTHCNMFYTVCMETVYFFYTNWIKN